MANNPDGARESYHEVPARKYIFLFQTAIHKRFFKYWTLILVAGTYMATRLFSLDYWLLHNANVTIRAYPVPFGIGAGVLVVAFMLSRRSNGRAKRLQKQLQVEVKK